MMIDFNLGMGSHLKFFSSSIFIMLCAFFSIIFFTGCEVPTRENFKINRVVISDEEKGQTFISQIQNAVATSNPTTIAPDSKVQTLAYIGDAMRSAYDTHPNVQFNLDLTQLKITQLYADFAGCKNLVKVTMSTAISNMEAGTFEGCTNLTSVSFKHSGGDDRWNNTSLPANAFKGCVNLTVIPKVKSNYSYNIGNGAFYGCKALTNATILEAITRTPNTTINPTAFYGTGLTDAFEIPANVTSIGEGAFGGTGITSVSFATDSKLVTLGGFADCKSLTSVDVTNATQLNELGSRAFDGSGITNVDSILAKVTRVGSYALSNCKSLTIVNLKATAPISEGMFSGSGLTAVTIPSGVTSIAASAFENCTELTTVAIPASVTEIKAKAFSDCSNLATITFNGTVDQWTGMLTKIDRSAFSGVKATEITCSGGGGTTPIPK